MDNSVDNISGNHFHKMHDQQNGPVSPKQTIDVQNQSTGKTSTENMEFDPTVLSFINNLQHPKIFLGRLDPAAKLQASVSQTKKLNPREKRLFKYVNTVLQYPPNAAAYTKTLSIRTQIAYSGGIAQYVLHVAAHTDFDEKTFKVDGILMSQCVKITVETRKLKAEYIRKFKHGLKVLQECLGVYKTAHIKDKDYRALVMHREWLTIPNVDQVHALYKAKVHEEDMAFAKEKSAKSTPKKYTNTDIKNMMINMLQKTSSGKRKHIYDGINAMMEFLMGYHLLLAGPQKVNLKLSDLVYTEVETPNGTVPILGFKTRPEEIRIGTGKNGIITPSTPDGPGYLQYPGAFRSKDAETCLVSAVAFSLWFRFDFADLGGPFSAEDALEYFKSSTWKDSRILFSLRSGSKSSKGVGPTYMHTLATMCFDSIGYKSAKKMNAGRNTNLENYALHMSEFQESPQNPHYLPYDLDFIRFSAGLEPEEPYCISRDVVVPEKLQQMVFPWLDEVREELGDVSSRHESDEEDNESGEEVSGGALAFLEMLHKFRSVIVQDLALLVDKAPNSIYAKHPITRDPLFVKFKKTVDRSTKIDSLVGKSNVLNGGVDHDYTMCEDSSVCEPAGEGFDGAGYKQVTTRCSTSSSSPGSESESGPGSVDFLSGPNLEARLPDLIALSTKQALEDMLSDERMLARERHQEVMQTIKDTNMEIINTLKASMVEIMRDTMKDTIKDAIRETLKEMEEKDAAKVAGGGHSLLQNITAPGLLGSMMERLSREEVDVEENSRPRKKTKTGSCRGV